MREGAGRSADGWTPLGVVGAVVWVLATAAAALFFSYLAGLATAPFFGIEPTRAEYRRASRYAWIASFALAAGPFGVGVVRRTRPWLVATVPCFLVGAVWAITLMAKGSQAGPGPGAI